MLGKLIQLNSQRVGFGTLLGQFVSMGMVRILRPLLVPMLLMAQQHALRSIGTQVTELMGRGITIRLI